MQIKVFSALPETLFIKINISRALFIFIIQVISIKTFHILINLHTKYLFVQFNDCNHLVQKCLYRSL